MASQDQAAPSTTCAKPASQGDRRRRRKGSSTALERGPRKRPCQSDPLVHHGRHFGRTIHALCNINSLLANGVIRLVEAEDEDINESSLSSEERREINVLKELFRLVPDLEERIMNASEEELRFIGDSLQKGADGGRADDTKTLKPVVIDWLAPIGAPLIPPLARNVKGTRGFNHDATGALLCPATMDWTDPEVKQQLRDGDFIVPGDQWPIFIYRNYKYDPNDPWEGLLRSNILIKAYKHVFTCPSSVDKDPTGTRGGNARIHGMQSVTIASIVYVATQLRFALSSASTFSRTDTVTDSQRFYNSLIEFLDHPDEQELATQLRLFWNRAIFPEHSAAQRPITKDSALARLKELRAIRKSQGGSNPLPPC